MAQRKPKATPPQSDLLRLEYVLLDNAAAWDRNPKRHDVGAIWESIQKHGLKDPPKFEPQLNAGKGGIVEGNGRTHVLREMRLANEPAPRGVLVDAEGAWLIPMLFGVDADSERAAEAYGVDHNNLVLSGGDFSAFDMSKMWDEASYAALLTDLAQFQELPVSVDGEDVDDLIGRLANGGSGSGAGSSGAGEAERGTPESNKVPADDRYREQYGVIVVCSDEADQKAAYERLVEEGYTCKVVTT